jgi:hypothetical protein
VRDITDDQEFQEFFMDDEEDHSIRGSVFPAPPEKRMKQDY